jgi:hypothetical protein
MSWRSTSLRCHLKDTTLTDKSVVRLRNTTVLAGPQAATVYFRVSAEAWQPLARVRSRSISARSTDAMVEKVLDEHGHLRMVCFGRCTIVHSLADGGTCLPAACAPAEMLESELATDSATVSTSSTTAALAAWTM